MTMIARKITSNLKLSEILNGQILLIDKEEDWTSFDVVNKIKFYILKNSAIKKIKIGHAGTLDPFATGLLLIATGKKTKTIDSFVSQRKTYLAEFEFGKATDSYDKTGKTTNEYSGELPNYQDIEQCISENFLGEIDQLAPMFSAKKVNGKRLYKYAREGIEVERKKNRIQIYSYNVLSYEKNLLKVEIICSKGTYIRSLAHDLGEQLKVPAFCKELRRTSIGDFSVANSLKINSFLDKIELDTKYES